MISDPDAGVPGYPTQNDGRSIIGTAFELLDQVAALQPVVDRLSE
jgi:hypothetical protein